MLITRIVVILLLASSLQGCVLFSGGTAGDFVGHEATYGNAHKHKPVIMRGRAQRLEPGDMYKLNWARHW